MKKRIRLTEGQLKKLIRKVINENTRGCKMNESSYPQPTDDGSSDKQQLVDFIIQTLRNTFLTSVWDVNGYVELYEDGEKETRDIIEHIQVVNDSDLYLYDSYVGNKWYVEEVDISTLRMLANYIKKEEQKAQSRGIVSGIEISRGIKGMILPYRVIGDERIMPKACKDYAEADQFVSANDFYFKDFEDALSYEVEDGDYTNESLARKVTESIIRKLRRV